MTHLKQREYGINRGYRRKEVADENKGRPSELEMLLTPSPSAGSQPKSGHVQNQRGSDGKIHFPKVNTEATKL
jgi:hypothetical protein